MSAGTPALAAQLDLIEWLKTHGEAWVDWFWGTFTGKKKMQKRDGILATLMEVRRAKTVFVSREMCDLIEKAAMEMPDIPLQHENLFWDSAFVYFERPIRHQYLVSPVDPGMVTTRAIFFMDFPYVLQAETAEDPKPAFKRGAIHFTFVDVEETPMDFEELGSKLFPFDSSAWTYGKRWQTVPHGESEWGSKVDEGLAQQRKLMLAVNLIASQHVALVSSQRGLRQQRRRAERMDLPNYGDIVYVTLRRARQKLGSGDSDPEFEYSHRFMVSGHWRHQWYPSKGEHHLIWVDPFIKGPEDRPLIIKDRVWKVVR